MKNSRSTRILLGVVFLFGVACGWAQDWPQWRGPNRDNRVTGFVAPETWPKALTKKWTVKVGIGEASPVLVGDKVYVFGRQGGDEVTMCLDAATGKEIWREKYAAAKITGSAGGYPGPRSTPAVGEGKVCTLGVHGVVSCLDATSGQVVWRKETSRPQFYCSTSPLIVDGKCIVYAGALTAFDLANGNVKWKWAGGGAPYGSPVLMSAGQDRHVVTPSSGALAAVNLADGKLLWQAKIGGGGGFGDYQSHYSTPIIDGQNVYYSMSSKGGGKGGKGPKGGAGSFMALHIEKKDDGFKATELWKKPAAAHGYHAPVLKDGLLYGVSLSGRNFFCLDAKTGNELWRDKTQRGQCGSILSAGNLLIGLTSDQQLVAFKAGNKGYEEVAKYQVGDDETWCVPILAGKRLFVKDKGGSLTLLMID